MTQLTACHESSTIRLTHPSHPYPQKAAEGGTCAQKPVQRAQKADLGFGRFIAHAFAGCLSGLLNVAKGCWSEWVCIFSLRCRCCWSLFLTGTILQVLRRRCLILDPIEPGFRNATNIELGFEHGSCAGTSSFDRDLVPNKLNMGEATEPNMGFAIRFRSQHVPCCPRSRWPMLK